MRDWKESIVKALRDGASDGDKAAGITTCRSLLERLGERAQELAIASTPAQPPQLTQMLGAVIGRLKAELGDVKAETEGIAATLKIPFVPVPPAGRER